MLDNLGSFVSKQRLIIVLTSQRILCCLICVNIKWCYFHMPKKQQNKLFKCSLTEHSLITRATTRFRLGFFGVFLAMSRNGNYCIIPSGFAKLRVFLRFPWSLDRPVRSQVFFFGQVKYNLLVMSLASIVVLYTLTILQLHTPIAVNLH